jgi:catechol 2,3-dioxygenase-like lactoylglutathione lyase family enzyme
MPLRGSFELLGGMSVHPVGPDDDMAAVYLDHDAMLLYMTALEVPRGHVALRVDADRFGGAVDWLGARGIAFGNDPGAPNNGETADCIGTGSRVYFSDPDGDLIELATPA